MPPKKVQTNGSASEKPIQAGAAAESKDEAPTSKTNDGAKTDGIPKKRKAPASTEPNKAPRRSARSAAPPAPVDVVKMLQFLLSPSSLDLCRPTDEIEDLKTRGPEIRTYSTSTSTFTPFEELVCAVILSRPIGHMLGVRSIRTIFNPPYGLTTPKTIRKAGNEGCRHALDEARTQHRQKTAEELVLLADAVVNSLGSGDEDVSLERVREESGHDCEKERDMLRKNVKGLGKTGLNIFGRRIQSVWPNFYPFVDPRTLAAAEKLGLPGSADELRNMLDEHWEKLEAKDIEAKDEEEKKRKAFVRLLERAVGADLEGNIDSVQSEAA